MSDNKTTTGKDYEKNDEAELDRLDANLDNSGQTDAEPPNNKRSVTPWLITAAIVAVIAIVGIVWIIINRSPGGDNVAVEVHKDQEPGHSENETGKEVKLSREMIDSAGLLIEAVTQRAAITKLFVTGAVELNPEKTEMATPLVGGRIERVYFGVGDNVRRGAVLAIISSPQLAQMHGKMHEAKTRYELAKRKLIRVQKAENRVAVLQARAKLDEADATLKRTRRLIELGAGAGKDLISAETAYRTAKADYEFQSNISLNKEIQEARAEVETAEVDLHHIEDEMRSLGVPVETSSKDDHRNDTSLVAVRAPLSGVITERKFNAGAGVEAATPIFAISNLSTVYVIANVPESNVHRLVLGAVAEIRSPAIGNLTGRVSYIDPQLDETTRTARVRVEVPNTNGKLRAGMFAEVGFYAGTTESTVKELAVPSDAIQREGDRNVVFIPKDDEPGAFEVREVKIGGEADGYTIIVNGLEIGEKVVTKGSFVLKSQLQKGDLGDHGH